MTDNNIPVIGFIDWRHIGLRRPLPEINPCNIVKGYFKTISHGQPIQKTIGNFIKISYLNRNELSNAGYFFIECLIEDATGMPSQFLNDNQEFEVVFNEKRYEYKDLRRLYMDYVNYETVNMVNSLP